ncbi:MAG TPA: hypothetical protein VGN57_14740 [Pirellulaceae bacterium]|nr:hypothetical protein [Pirellulaceae bacterium]
MRRTLIGILGLAGVVFGLASGTFGLAGESVTFFGNSCLRVGVVLLCWWAAYRQLQSVGRTLPLWIVGGIAFLVFVVAAFKNTVYFVAPLIALLAAIGCFWWMAKAPFQKRKKPRPKTVAGKVTARSPKPKRVETEEPRD